MISLARFLRATSASASSLAVLLAMPGVAVGVDVGFDWRRDASYALTVNGSGIDWVVEIPRSLPHRVGLGQVDLVHDLDQREGRCEARGAGYTIPDEVQEGLLGGKGGWSDPDPSELDTRMNRPVVDYNPTMARSVAGNYPVERQPEVRVPVGRPDQRLIGLPVDGSPIRWTASCIDDVAGTATGNHLQHAIAKLANGTASAAVDKATGRYTGIARGYAAGVRTPTGTLGSVSSLLQVTLRPGVEPVVTYRLAVSEITGTEAQHRFDHAGFTLVGQDVPASRLTAQFNEQVARNADALAALGPAGLALLKPQVERGRQSYQADYAIAAPVLQANAGLAARNGTIGQNQTVLLCATRFEGTYQGRSGGRQVGGGAKRMFRLVDGRWVQQAR